MMRRCLSGVTAAAAAAARLCRKKTDESWLALALALARTRTLTLPRTRTLTLTLAQVRDDLPRAFASSSRPTPVSFRGQG